MILPNKLKTNVKRTNIHDASALGVMHLIYLAKAS